VNELTEETSILGAVPEADQDDLTFEVQTYEGQKVRAPITPQHLDTIIEAFNGYRAGTRVSLHGIGRFNRNYRLLGFESIEHMNILDERDVQARLDELRQLKDGWLEGCGLAPSNEGLDWLSQAFDQHYPDQLPLPFLYPTEEGGIQAEWTLAENEVTVEIDLGSRIGRWHALNIETGKDESQELNLQESSSWKWLINQIQLLMGGAV
jgi:hypothetical protein